MHLAVRFVHGRAAWLVENAFPIVLSMYLPVGWPMVVRRYPSRQTASRDAYPSGCAFLSGSGTAQQRQGQLVLLGETAEDRIAY